MAAGFAHTVYQIEKEKAGVPNPCLSHRLKNRISVCVFRFVCVCVSPLPLAKDIILLDLSISSPHMSRFVSHPGQSPGEVITDQENIGLPGRSLSE